MDRCICVNLIYFIHTRRRSNRKYTIFSALATSLILITSISHSNSTLWFLLSIVYDSLLCMHTIWRRSMHAVCMHHNIPILFYSIFLFFNFIFKEQKIIIQFQQLTAPATPPPPIGFFSFVHNIKLWLTLIRNEKFIESNLTPNRRKSSEIMCIVSQVILDVCVRTYFKQFIYYSLKYDYILLVLLLL